MGLGGQESLSATSPQAGFSVLVSSPSLFYSQNFLTSFTFSTFSVFLLPFPFLPSLFPLSALGFPGLHLPINLSPRSAGSPPGPVFWAAQTPPLWGLSPKKDLVLILVLTPCTPLRIASRGLGDFSQGQIQGCCGSGQLLPEPPCPPPSPGDRKACQGLALSWRLPIPPSRAGGVVGVPVSLRGSPQLL